jgi:hypothetical protein
MATRKLTYRVQAKSIPDTGRDPVGELDTDLEAAPLILTSFVGWKRESLKIAAGTADQAFTFTDAVAMLVFADVPIQVRLAAGEAQPSNLRFFGWCADDAETSCHTTSILLSVPGADPANVEILFVEKV